MSRVATLSLFHHAPVFLLAVNMAVNIPLTPSAVVYSTFCCNAISILT